MEPDSLDYTPARMLQEIVADFADPSRPESCLRGIHPDKMFVICLWDEDGKYNRSFYNAGLSATQIIALLEIQKQVLVQMVLTEREEDDED